MTVDLKMAGDEVTDFAHEVKACALGQASSSIMARNVIGAKADELRSLREAVRKMLKENGSPPATGRWADVAVLEPVRDYKARHASTLLTFDAVVDAIDQIEAKRRGGAALPSDPAPLPRIAALQFGISPVNPPRERMFNVPGAVLALVALLAIIHLVLAFTLTTAQTNELLSLFAFNPLRYTLPAYVVPGGWGSRLWTFVSYAFIHADLNHLVFNLLWLLAFGAPVARRFGSWRFLAFCAATAAAGAAAHLVTHWGEFAAMIGASAAVSGTMAAAMRFVFQRRAPLGILGSDEAGILSRAGGAVDVDAARPAHPAVSWRSGLASISCSASARSRCRACKAPSPGRPISAASWPGSSASACSIRRMRSIDHGPPINARS